MQSSRLKNELRLFLTLAVDLWREFCGCSDGVSMGKGYPGPTGYHGGFLHLLRPFQSSGEAMPHPS